MNQLTSYGKETGYSTDVRAMGMRRASHAHTPTHAWLSDISEHATGCATPTNLHHHQPPKQVLHPHGIAHVPACTPHFPCRPRSAVPSLPSLHAAAEQDTKSIYISFLHFYTTCGLQAGYRVANHLLSAELAEALFELMLHYPCYTTYTRHGCYHGYVLPSPTA